MKRLFTLILFLVLCATSAFAQFKKDTTSNQEGVAKDNRPLPTARPMSLRDCMLYAVENSRTAKIQEAKNDQYRLQYRESYLNFVPSVSGRVTANGGFGRGIDPETNTYISQTSFGNDYSINANYTIFEGFNVINNYRIRKVAKLSGVEEYQQIEDEICLTTMQAYFNVLYRIGMVEIRGKQLKESKENLYQAQVMEELGTKSHADVLQVEAKVAEDDYNYVKEQNSLDDELLNLKKAMFYPVYEDLQIDTNMVWSVDPFFEEESSDSIFEYAKTFLPSIKIADYTVQKAKYGYQSAKLNILPSLYLSGGIGTQYSYGWNNGKTYASFADQMTGNIGESIGLQMNIPIFSSLSRHTTRGLRKNDYMIAQFQKEQKLQEVSTEIQRAVQDMEGAAKEYIHANKRESSQEIAYRANVQKYNEGMVSILDLQTSSNNLLAARAQTLYSALAYLIKTKIVNYYKGIPYLAQE